MLRRLLMLTILSLCGVSSAALAAKFDHAAHNEYVEGTPCSACHVAGAPSIVPDLKLCLECHDEEFTQEVELPGLNTHGPVWPLNHRAAAKANAPDCAACHLQSDCLDCHKAGFADEMGSLGNQMLNVHRSDFNVTHPIAARANGQLCASCHESRFCNDCHDAFRVGRASGPSHQRTFDLGLTRGVAGHADIVAATGISLGVGADCDACHLPGSVAQDFHAWSSNHKREARKHLATCQACHPSGDTCLRCHSDKGGSPGFNPHGKGWADRAGRLNDASNGKTCRKCH
jgi:Cytochrome c7 and related cytochrome c